MITSASLADPNSGSTATVNENGVQITTNGQTSEGIFVNNTPAADIQGSGKLAGFSFHISSSNVATGMLDAGTYTGPGGKAGMIATLNARGAFQYTWERLFGDPYHKGYLNFRFTSGSYPQLFDYGPSPHLLVSSDPRATVPGGPFHVDSHTGSLAHGTCAVLHVGCQ